MYLNMKSNLLNVPTKRILYQQMVFISKSYEELYKIYEI